MINTTRIMVLAPVVRDRKGEHQQLFEELRAQGFIRARVDGKVVELDQPPALDLRRAKPARFPSVMTSRL